MDTPNREPAPNAEQIAPPYDFTIRDRWLAAVAFVLCFALAVAFTSFSAPRLGITLLTLAAQGAFFWYNGKCEYNRYGLLIMGAGALLALSFIANANTSLYAINLLAVLALTVWGALMASGSGGFNWERPRGFISGSFHAVALLFCDIGKPIRAVAASIKHKSVFKVILGVVLSLPLLLIVAFLLSNADAAFNDFSSAIIENLSEDIVIFGARSFVAFCLALPLYSFFFGVKSKRAVNGVPLSGDGELKGGDGIVFLTLTVLLNAIYAVFVYFQFVYLFGGRVPKGVTYADYARGGFFELTFITLLNLSVIMLALTFTSRDRRAALYIRISGGIMMCFTSVILASAVYRMLLYIGAYGLSVLRFLVLWGELVMLIWIILCGIKIARPDSRIFKPMAAVTLVLYLALNFCNVDYIVAAYNISRGSADTEYLHELSTDVLLASGENSFKRTFAYDKAHNFWSWNITDAIVGKR